MSLKWAKWTVNIEHATLKGLKNSIHEKYQPPSLENDGAVLTFVHDGDRSMTEIKDKDFLKAFGE